MQSMKTYTAVDETTAKAPARYSEDQHKSNDVFTNKYAYTRKRVVNSHCNIYATSHVHNILCQNFAKFCSEQEPLQEKSLGYNYYAIQTCLVATVSENLESYICSLALRIRGGQAKQKLARNLGT